MKNKNTLLSLVFIVAAPLWVWITTHLSSVPYATSLPAKILKDGFVVYILPYFVLLLVGIFFGWKNLKNKQSSVLSNLITLIGAVMFLGSIVYYFWLLNWVG